MKRHKKTVKKPDRSRKLFGFSLVELLVVISILIILLAIILLSYTNTAKASRDSQRDKDLNSVKVALEQYYEVYGVYPTGSSVDDLLADPNFSQFVQTVSIKDPLNQPPYIYTYSSDGKTYELGAQKETTQSQSSSGSLASNILPTATSVPAPTSTPGPTAVPTNTPPAGATATPSITPTVTTAQTISSLNLMDAEADTVVKTMSLSDDVDLSDVSQFTFTFSTNPSTVGSTKIEVIGPTSYTRYENYLPYAIGIIDEMERDDYLPLDWPLGNYTLRLTPYSQANGAGAPGTAKTYTIAVVQNGAAQPTPTPLPAGAVNSFSLIDTNDGSAVLTLTNGYTIHKSQYPDFSVKVNTTPQNVAYVKIEVTGAQNFTDYQNVYPYSIAPYEDGVYENWAPPNGSYTIKATSYGPTQEGQVGTSKTINITVAN